MQSENLRTFGGQKYLLIKSSKSMKKKLFLLLAVIMSLSQLLAQESITIGTGTTTTGSGPIPGFMVITVPYNYLQPQS